MKKKIRLIVAETSEVFRKSLVALLETEHEFHVAGQASNGRELLALLKQIEADIVLLDTQMPVVDGKAALEIIHRRFPATRVIIMSEITSTPLQTDFMLRGANSFLGKNCTVLTLFLAINKVKSEGYYFDESTSKALLETVQNDRHRSSAETLLNERESDILKGIWDGNTNKQIASNLNISTSLVDLYRAKIYHKTKCTNVTGLLKYALRNGLISLT